MPANALFTSDERVQLTALYKELLSHAADVLQPNDVVLLRNQLVGAARCGLIKRDIFGLNPIIKDLQTALIVVSEIGITRGALLGLLVHTCVSSGYITTEQAAKQFGSDVATIIEGLNRIQTLYEKNADIQSENFRTLLLSFALDMRVILIMIANRLNLMRNIKDAANDDARRRVSFEAASLYAPLAHKLGLYRLKSELEDLSLKYLEHDAYYHIKEKLNATKKARDAYIERFIQPIDQALNEAHLQYHIKGRTKSIHSIWQKMKKQRCAFEGIYDLFAIRIILDSPPDKEKLQCWQVYSIVTDMFRPNPRRLRDWLSIPKSNGYESLHITVLGPDDKWVEVQIRTERMDEIAERGLAAHWRYKGVNSGSEGVDQWLNKIRGALESGDDEQLMHQFKVDIQSDEVFVFTPRGDLFRLPKGATVLDFAYAIHTNVGDHCVGAKVNGRNNSFRQILVSGDSVEIQTATNQTPKQDWINHVVTSKARTKIRQALKETDARQTVFAKEQLLRKFKNRKIDYDEPTLMRLIQRLGFKNVTDFYKSLADGHTDVNIVIDKYLDLLSVERNIIERTTSASAADYNLTQVVPDDDISTRSKDVLVVGSGLKGVQFTLARCCQPIYGDDVIGFVTTGGGISIHRRDCPNAVELVRRYPYRILPATWGNAHGGLYPITLRVVGNDDIGIVNNITSVISKEEKLLLRTIRVDSLDGLFSGTLTVMVDDTSRLQTLLRKLRTVKGVKHVERI